MIRNVVGPVVRPVVSLVGEVIRSGLASGLDLTQYSAAYDVSVIGSLWQDASRTIPVTADGQPVAMIDDLSGHGRHAPLAGVYHASGGKFWVSTSGAASVGTAITLPLQLPAYIGLAIDKGAETGGSYAAIIQDSVNHLSISALSASRTSSQLRSSARGQVAPSSSTGEAGPTVISASSIVGTSTVTNNIGEASIANTWLSGDLITSAKVRLGDGGIGSIAYNLYAALFHVGADMDARRVAGNEWLETKK